MIKAFRPESPDYLEFHFFYFIGCLFTFRKKNYGFFMVKKLFIEIRLRNPMTYVFKGHVKIIERYMVKFNISTSNRL